MPYEHIPGIGATYLDGAFRTIINSTQPRILVLGSSKEGVAYSIFGVNNTQDAETEFGSDAELMKPLHEALEQGADNIAVMRIGGTRGRFTATDDEGNVLEIYPERRDDDALARYALFITNDGTTNNILVYDTVREIYVYDSDEVEVLDTGLVEVIGDLALCTVNDTADLAAADTLKTLVGSDFTFPGGEEIASIALLEGSDGLTMSKMELYHALEQGYQFLDYEDADMLIPTGVFLDDLNQEDEGNGAAGMNFSGFASTNALPDKGDADDGLGYLWKFLYRGKPYCVFFENEEPFKGTSAYDDADLTTDMHAQADALKMQPADGLGDLGSILSFSLSDAGVGKATTITVSATTAGLLHIACAIDFAEHAAFDKVKTELEGNATFIKWLKVTDGFNGISTVAIAETQVGTSDGDTLDSRVILTNLLDGETLPFAVLDRLRLGEDAEVRHVNFSHQLAYACMRASTTWSTMLGFISVNEPPAYSRAAVAEWIGQEPDYSFTGTDLSVPDNASEGEGVLGHMLHAGMYDYRAAKIKTGATAQEGYAYGGYILTEGDSLPTLEAYGIEDDDESLDLKGEPIDIGKHILVTASWPILSNSWNGGSQYRGSICGTIAGKIAITPEKEEPIGINGVVRSIRRPPRMRTPLINSLSKLRFVTTRREEGLGHILVSVKTAAHPDSDYVRLSTIRSVNREISGIRDICKPYIGKEFSSTRLASLQTSINGFLKGEKELGYNQGAIAAISYTRADKIMGRLTIKLKMIPPFSIESITIETTLAAEESELTT
ncbi:MAG: hypothetical protein CMB80_03360 [Flammeovirgaceae bacterium]|nr:hypothetical protein [Flammeovirgaceae bacterium]